MGYKYQEIDISKWYEINKKSGMGVFGGEDFLYTTAQIFQYNVVFCLILFNEKPVLSVPLFTKNKKVVFPNHYFYQYIWQSEIGKESWLILDAWDLLLKELQLRYNKIKIRLPVSVNDIRPFIWNEFKITAKFTYFKNLQDLNYHTNINRILKKESIGYSFKKNCNWEENWAFHYADLKKLGIRGVYLNDYIKYFKSFNKETKVQVFNAYYNDVFLTSIVSIIDENIKTAYFPLIGTAAGHYNSGLPTMLYNYAFSELKSEGMDGVDLFGANLKSIAKYKSKFLPNLEVFYEVCYSKRIFNHRKIYFPIRRLIGKILFWVH